MKNITIIVPARAGSVGVKNKNLCKINGRSLIQRSVDLAISLQHRVVVTTNINNPLPKKYEGIVQVHNRPEHLCNNETQMIPVIRDVIDEFKITGVIVLLQPTSPLRTDKQLREILEMYFLSKPTLCLSATLDDSVILKNFIKIGNNFSPISFEGYLFQNRQMLPEVFKPNGAFYVFDAEDFIANSFNTEDIAIYEMDKITSLDVDTEEDLVSVRKYATS